MEFYAYALPASSFDIVHAALGIANLPRLCASISSVLRDGGDEGDIYCVWGEFHVRREAIRDGIRYTLPKCPNALAWTVTRVPDDSGRWVVHLTINRPTHDDDFIASIEDFVADWQRGLAAL